VFDLPSRHAKKHACSSLDSLPTEQCSYPTTFRVLLQATDVKVQLFFVRPDVRDQGSNLSFSQYQDIYYPHEIHEFIPKSALGRRNIVARIRIQAFVISISMLTKKWLPAGKETKERPSIEE
jgi:hypothetical protein